MARTKRSKVMASPDAQDQDTPWLLVLLGTGLACGALVLLVRFVLIPGLAFIAHLRGIHGIPILAVIAGGILALIRARHRRVYGVIEIVVGIAVAHFGVFAYIEASNSAVSRSTMSILTDDDGLAVVLAFLSAVFLIARGLHTTSQNKSSED